MYVNVDVTQKYFYFKLKCHGNIIGNLCANLKTRKKGIILRKGERESESEIEERNFKFNLQRQLI